MSHLPGVLQLDFSFFRPLNSLTLPLHQPLLTIMKNLWLMAVLTAASATRASNTTFLQCLEATFGNDTNLYSLPQDPLFLQGDVTPYNLNYLTIPAAIVSPRTQQQVSGAVKCAHTAGVAVQARSGGHSYANYGKTECGKKVRGLELADNGVVCRTRRVQWLIGCGYEEYESLQL